MALFTISCYSLEQLGQMKCGRFGLPQFLQVTVGRLDSLIAARLLPWRRVECFLFGVAAIVHILPVFYSLGNPMSMR